MTEHLYIPPGKHLKKRMVKYFSAFVTITMLIITVCVILMMALELKKHLDDALYHEVREIAMDLEREIIHLKRNIIGFNNNGLIINSLIDPQGRADYLPEMIKNFSVSEGVESIALVDFEGKLIYSDESSTDLSGSSMHIRTTLVTGNSSIFIGKNRELIIAHPISYYQTTQGASVVKSSFKELVVPILEGRRNLFVEMNADSESVFINNPGIKEEYIKENFFADDKTPLLKQLQIEIVAGVPRSKFVNPVKLAVLELILISGFLIIVSIMVANHIGDSITRPILKLCDKVGMSGAKESSSCYPVGTDDELEDLAWIFDRRSAELINSRKNMELINKQLRNEISQRVEVEKKLKKSYDELEQRVEERTSDLAIAKASAESASRIKSQFLANMSHEIRTPMNSVLGFLNLSLEKADLSGFHRNNIKIAYKSANALLLLINDILDVSKLESGKLELDERSFDLSGIMQEIRGILDVNAREKNIEIVIDIHNEVSQYYFGDPSRLGQILLNLAGNAIKFTKKGRVKISAAPWNQEGFLHFIVADSGIGIAPERLEIIFEPFIQADSSTSRRYGGTGLGTTISKQLSELMGGKIWAESEVGKGSKFHFTIKMKATDQKPESGIRDTFKAWDMRYKTLRKFRILLAEDIEENIALAEIRLNRQGHEIVVAKNGIEAVNTYNSDRNFDVIIMDVHMPEMDGLEATRQIREMEKNQDENITIIALTASIMKDEREACIESGMNGVIGKPVDFDDLFIKMNKLIPPEKGKIQDFENHEKADFKKFPVPEIDGVDTGKGIRAWQDIDAYLNAIIRFADDNKDLPNRLQSLIHQENIEQAYSLIHTLKGVSGNLSAGEIHDISLKLETAVRDKQIKYAQKLVIELESSIKSLSCSIEKFKKNKPAESPDKKNNNIPVIRDIMINLLQSYETFNPDAVKPFLNELSGYVSKDQISPIRNQVSRFDFEECKKETINLAVLLNIKL